MIFLMILPLMQEIVDFLLALADGLTTKSGLSDAVGDGEGVGVTLNSSTAFILNVGEEKEKFSISM